MYNDNRVHIDFGPSVSGNNVKITHNGEVINGISRLQIDVKPNALIETKLTMHDAVIEQVDGVVIVYMIDPSDNKLKRVKNINFED